MTEVALGVVQCSAATLDPEANAAGSSARIRTAAARGATLVVLPELVATSYYASRDKLLPIAESVTDPGPCLSAWSSTARELKVTVVAGFAEREGDKLFNSAVVIDSSGRFVEVYRKLHLFGVEHRAFSPGDRGLPVVDVDGVRLGVLVCYDLRFPETVRIMALRGAEVIAVPTAWVGGFDRAVPPDGRIGQVDGALVQCNLNQVFMACADQVGTTGSVSFLGRSVVINPFGQALAGPLSPDDEDIVVVPIDTGEVERARHRGPGIDPMENRRTDVYDAMLGYQEPASPSPLGG